MYFTTVLANAYFLISSILLQWRGIILHRGTYHIYCLQWLKFTPQTVIFPEGPWDSVAICYRTEVYFTTQRFVVLSVGGAPRFANLWWKFSATYKIGNRVRAKYFVWLLLRLTPFTVHNILHMRVIHYTSYRHPLSSYWCFIKVHETCILYACFHFNRNRMSRIFQRGHDRRVENRGLGFPGGSWGGAASPLPTSRESGERCELPHWSRGGTPTVQRFPLFSALRMASLVLTP